STSSSVEEKERQQGVRPEPLPRARPLASPLADPQRRRFLVLLLDVAAVDLARFWAAGCKDPDDGPPLRGCPPRLAPPSAASLPARGGGRGLWRVGPSIHPPRESELEPGAGACQARSCWDLRVQQAVVNTSRAITTRELQVAWNRDLGRVAAAEASAWSRTMKTEAARSEAGGVQDKRPRDLKVSVEEDGLGVVGGGCGCGLRGSDGKRLCLAREQDGKDVDGKGQAGGGDAASVVAAGKSDPVASKKQLPFLKVSSVLTVLSVLLINCVSMVTSTVHQQFLVFLDESNNDKLCAKELGGLQRPFTKLTALRKRSDKHNMVFVFDPAPGTNLQDFRFRIVSGQTVVDAELSVSDEPLETGSGGLAREFAGLSGDGGGEKETKNKALKNN
ncbi:unnamed protein product, partial [Durusdinium trenchii]